MGYLQIPQDQLLDAFTWSATVANNTSATLYTSSSVNVYNELPEATPMYAKLQMTGGGLKLGSTENPTLAFYPLMLVVTETSPYTGGASFKRYYPFPGPYSYAFTVAYIPLRSMIKRPGFTQSTFTFSVAAPSAGENDFSSANGNQGEVVCEIYTGTTVERELSTIQHNQASASYTANQAVSSFSWRRAHQGAVLMTTSSNGCSYRIRALNHRAFDTTNVLETIHQITSGSVTSTAQVAVPTSNTWIQPAMLDYYSAGTLNAAAFGMSGAIIGGPY
jgi:hypothetical protein